MAHFTRTTKLGLNFGEIYALLSMISAILIASLAVQSQILTNRSEINKNKVEIENLKVLVANHEQRNVTEFRNLYLDLVERLNRMEDKIDKLK